jgi:hypothetical protein
MKHIAKAVAALETASFATKPPLHRAAKPYRHPRLRRAGHGVAHETHRTNNPGARGMTHKDQRRIAIAIEIITGQQLTNYAKTLETKRLKRDGKCLSFSSISRHAHKFIVECMGDDKGTLRIRHGWREAMRAAAEA